MIKAFKSFGNKFAEAFAGGFFSAIIFAFCKELLVHHEVGFAAELWISILVYTSIYSCLFAILHIGGKPNLRSTCFAAFTMVVLASTWVFYEDRFVSFTIWDALGQFVFALLLTALTYFYVRFGRTPLPSVFTAHR